MNGGTSGAGTSGTSGADAGPDAASPTGSGGVAQDSGSDAPSGCSSDQDCPLDRHCETKTRFCVECLASDHCPNGAKCNTSTHVCELECRGNADCGTQHPICDTNAHICVSCLSNADCPTAGARVCDPTTRTCVACVKNTDCRCPLPGIAPCCTAQHTCNCSLLICL
jgi:Cys-rich repeat protein